MPPERTRKRRGRRGRFSILEVLHAVGPVFFGSLLQGCSGFGFSLFAVPLLLPFFPRHVVVPLLVLLSLAMNGLLFGESRRHATGATVLGLLLGGVSGLPLGMAALALLPASLFRLVAGLFVTGSALALSFGFRRPLTPGRGTLFGVGLLSGILNGSLSMSGPPVILFLANQEVGKEAFRATLAAYFLSLNVVTSLLFLLRGLFDGPLLLLAAASLPALLAGTWLGLRLARRLPERVFRAVALGLLLLMGMSLVVTAFFPA
ncbi:sulfite exporter TauE/SafE family protein [Aminirod propionatiphilus]|uniref:Sulfite exporter TauE/SafE family protein n=1 Tax=Aminirod propionatiphilus TaxID=3415223 RepID=A0ACD1DV77_9BACT|nr:sulfite exporter TauE/SafE family protein [Synergistota bacterium]